MMRCKKLYFALVLSHLTFIDQKMHCEESGEECVLADYVVIDERNLRVFLYGLSMIACVILLPTIILFLYHVPTMTTEAASESPCYLAFLLAIVFSFSTFLLSGVVALDLERNAPNRLHKKFASAFIFGIMLSYFFATFACLDFAWNEKFETEARIKVIGTWGLINLLVPVLSGISTYFCGKRKE